MVSLKHAGHWGLYDKYWRMHKEQSVGLRNEEDWIWRSTQHGNGKEEENEKMEKGE